MFFNSSLIMFFFLNAWIKFVVKIKSLLLTRHDFHMLYDNDIFIKFINKL